MTSHRSAEARLNAKDFSKDPSRGASWPFKAIPLAALLVGLVGFAGGARGEAQNTTTIGLGSRKLSLTPATGGGSGTATQSGSAVNNLEDELAGPALCNRVSVPASLLTVEIAAGGCLHVASSGNNFANSVSAYAGALYFPFAARRRNADDAVLRMRLLSLSNVYVMGLGGFSKITRGESLSPVSFTVDTFDAGIGGGYNYRLFRHVSLGAEGAFFFSSSLSSKVASGSASFMLISGTFTVFL